MPKEDHDALKLILGSQNLVASENKFKLQEFKNSCGCETHLSLVLKMKPSDE